MKKKVKLIRLPKSPNGTRRVHFGGGSYRYQREELQRRARKKRMTVSMYLNYLLWKDDYTSFIKDHPFDHDKA